MTEREFLDGIMDFEDLWYFCRDAGIEIEDRLYDADSKDDYYNERVIDWAHTYTWQEVLDLLNEIPDVGDWFVYDEDYELREATESDFDDLKEWAYEVACDNDLFDEDDDAEDDIDDDEEQLPFEDDDFEIEDVECLLEMIAMNYKVMNIGG